MSVKAFHKEQRGEITMIIEYLKKVRASETRTGKRMLLPLFFSLIVAASIWPAKAQAQIIGNLEANVPFQFHVGNNTLPAGRYIIHQLEASDLTIMEISSADGKLSALFSVESEEAKSTPEKT